MERSRLWMFGIYILLINYCSHFFIADAAPKSSAKQRLAEREALEDRMQALRRRAGRGESAASEPSSSSGAPQGGGAVQRLARWEAATEQTEPTPWTHTLKRDWARGRLSSVRVQEYAKDSAAQGARHLEGVAGTGSAGANPSHVHRDLLKLFGNPRGAPSIDWVDIPTKNGREAHPFLFPHKFFASLYAERRDLFDRALRGPVGAAREYWEALGGIDFVTKHPLLNDLDHALPIGVHGDAGAFSKHDSLMVVSWNGVLGQGTTRTKRFVFTFVRKAVYTKATLDRIFELLAWSVNAMQRGQQPTLDWNGQPSGLDPGPLAGQYSCILSQIRGDWAFYTEVFGFPVWNGAIRMCWMCRASGTIRHLSFTDTSEEAEWRNTRFNDDTYRAHMKGMGYALPVLLLLVIGMRLECFSIDALHAIDLGFGSHVIGNTFWESIRRHAWGASTLDANAERLNADMVKWSKENKVPSRIQGQLTAERIRSTSDSGYPKLKAKGAQTRHLAPYALHLARRFKRTVADGHDQTTADHDRTIVGICLYLCRMYHIFATSSQFFTDAIKAELRDIGNMLPQLYQRLYAEAARRGIKAWKMTPKLHLVQELLLFYCQVWGNPAYYWTYCDEDLVGLMVEIATSCHPRTMAATALVKWLVLCFDCPRDEE